MKIPIFLKKESYYVKKII